MSERPSFNPEQATTVFFLTEADTPWLAQLGFDPTIFDDPERLASLSQNLILSNNLLTLYPKEAQQARQAFYTELPILRKHLEAQCGNESLPNPVPLLHIAREHEKAKHS